MGKKAHMSLPYVLCLGPFTNLAYRINSFFAFSISLVHLQVVPHDEQLPLQSVQPDFMERYK